MGLGVRVKLVGVGGCWGPEQDVRCLGLDSLSGEFRRGPDQEVQCLDPESLSGEFRLPGSGSVAARGLLW